MRRADRSRSDDDDEYFCALCRRALTIIVAPKIAGELATYAIVFDRGCVPSGRLDALVGSGRVAHGPCAGSAPANFGSVSLIALNANPALAAFVRALPPDWRAFSLKHK